MAAIGKSLAEGWLHGGCRGKWEEGRKGEGRMGDWARGDKVRGDKARENRRKKRGDNGRLCEGRKERRELRVVVWFSFQFRKNKRIT
jgi:hypothetical protein